MPGWTRWMFALLLAGGAVAGCAAHSTPEPTDADQETGLDGPWVLVEQVPLDEQGADNEPDVWEYDALNQLVASTVTNVCRCVDGQETTRTVHEYSESAVVTRVDTNMDGSIDRVVDLSRDASGRWLRVDEELATSPTTYSQIFGYDSDGRLISIVYPASPSLDTVATRDAGGRMLSQVQAGEEIMSWRYDAEGRLVEKHSYLTRTVYEYDEQGRLIELRRSQDGTEDDVTLYEYDSQGRLIEVREDRKPNKETLVYEFEYDDMDRVVWTRLGWASNPGRDQRVVYDDEGKVVERDGLTYEYRSSGPNAVEMTVLRDGQEQALRRYRRLSGPATLPPTLPRFEDAEDELVALPVLPQPGPL